MGSTLMSTRVSELERQRDKLYEEVTYLQSQSLRNNLIFTNIPEDNLTGNESAEVSEQKLRDHLKSALKLSTENVDAIRFDRVHRSPGHPITGKTKNIVAKFTIYEN
ncbi:hypothetical protein DPMN_096040 [Dreissena polymorpha]|uniref:Uncharacterized protein n=1 Tax=Dreissena polymorpha TaxID=45954 RepID=A0A9D4R529_DREPO|nr:hypothetical protein DPMN_096040 [Dreissena polymorpha]